MAESVLGPSASIPELSQLAGAPPVPATPPAVRVLPRLIVHELGQGPLLPAIGQIVELTRRQGSKTTGRLTSRPRLALVVPTRSALEHAKNEVARLAGAADPRSFFTVLGLAKRLLGAECPRLAGPRARDVLLERTLRQPSSVPEPDRQRALDDLRGAARFRGFRHALLQLFAELEAAAIEPPLFARTLAAATRRLESPDAHDHARVVHTRIVEGYRAYRAALKRADLAVESDVLAKAARFVDQGRAAFSLPDHVVVDGFYDLTPRQVELLAAIARHAPETSVHWPQRTSPSRTGPLAADLAQDLESRFLESRFPGTLERGVRSLTARGFVSLAAEPLPESPDLRPRSPAVEHVVRSLFRSSERRGSTDGAVTFVRAGSPEDEAQVALRIARATALAGKSSTWNDVLVVVPDARAARAAFERAAHELAVPIRVHAARALAAHPAVQGALAFVRAAVTLESGALLGAAAVPALGLDARASERLTGEVRRRGLPSGREAFAALVQADRPDAPTTVPSQARGLVRDVLALARRLDPPGEASADAPLDAPLDASLAFAQVREVLATRIERPALRDYVVPASGSPAALSPQNRESSLDAALEAAADEVGAIDAFLQLLGELATLFAGERWTARELLARLEDEVRESDYVPRDRRRHVVHVVDLADARTFRAPVVVLAGLSEGAFPRASRDDLLEDGVRRSATNRGVALATADDHAEGERLLFLLAIASAQQEVHFVYPGFDSSGEPRAPSPFLEAVEGLFTDGAVAAARVKRSPSDVVAASLGELATVGDARRFAYLRASASFRASGERTSGGERTVAPAEIAAPSPEGRALQGAALLELLVRERALDTAPTLSAAQAQEGSRIRAALSPPTWRLETGPGPAVLDRVFSASELETYATCPYRHFVRHLLQVRRREDLATTGLDARLQGRIVHRALERAVSRHEPAGAAFDAAFAEGVRDLPLGPDEEAFRRSARAAVVAFLENDDPEFLARTGLDVSLARVEVPFGPGTDLGPLLVHDPVLNGSIQLEGRIDRIDEGPRGAFVTDYKLGTDLLDARARVALARGEKLQIPVYLLALARVLNQVPLGAALVALGSRRRTGIVSGAARDLAVDAPRLSLAAFDLDQVLAAAEESIRKIVRGISQGTIDAAPREPSECRRCEVRDVCRFRERNPGGNSMRSHPVRSDPSTSDRARSRAP